VLVAPLATLVVLSAPPLRLVQSVGGVPVGVVEAFVDADTYYYRVRHVFRQQTQRFEVHWRVDADGKDAQGLRAELFVLGRRPAPGCQVVREERTGVPERLCVDVDGRSATLDGAPLRLSYDASGALEVAELLDHRGGVLSRFDAKGPPPVPGAEPFADGFPIAGEPGRSLGMTPRGPATQVAVLGVETPSDDVCLPAARALVEKAPGASVQVGLVVEDGRAWPHAWVRRGDGTQVDPTRTTNEAGQRVYLAFPAAQAGRWFLELASGARTLTWRR
jgi:hypothetical protein